MKAHVLTLWLDGGGVQSVGAATAAEIAAVVAKVREDGTVGKGNKAEAVKRGCVVKLDAGHAIVTQQFRL